MYTADMVRYDRITIEKETEVIKRWIIEIAQMRWLVAARNYFQRVINDRTNCYRVARFRFHLC